MDRYFTSEDLLDLLHSECGASGTGTLQKQRIPLNSKLKEDKEMRKEGRGTQSVRSDGQISVINGLITKLRWCRVTRTFLDVDRPFAVKCYNTYMGGVDFQDQTD
ncbi:hypothetical protein J6590_009749 [Homalodisca vitripennis]|nr:hypothetical protein J6590_009749 [Homalodisca vitripennis]